jgi:hypothetical protein
MASRRPKLPPEISVPPTGAPAQRRTHVHLVPIKDRWGIRVGRRVVKTFADHSRALLAAIPMARQLGGRLFVHYESGIIREASTDPLDESFLRLWKKIHDDHNKPQPTVKTQPKAVHVVRQKDGWGIRVGRQVRQKRFSDRGDAVQAAMPYARKLEARLFVHFENGEVRESSTSRADEMMFKLWKSAYERNAEQAD